MHMDITRHAYAALFCETLHTRRDVSPVAVEITAFDNYVTVKKGEVLFGFGVLVDHILKPEDETGGFDVLCDKRRGEVLLVVFQQGDLIFEIAI